jgi:hypothetical protein
LPRYFFNVQHHTSQPDTDGVEFPDVHAAQVAAVRLCGEMIQEMDGKFWDAPTWRLEVSGHEQLLLFTLTFSAEEHDPDSQA